MQLPSKHIPRKGNVWSPNELPPSHPYPTDEPHSDAPAADLRPDSGLLCPCNCRPKILSRGKRYRTPQILLTCLPQDHILGKRSAEGSAEGHFCFLSSQDLSELSTPRLPEVLCCWLPPRQIDSHFLLGSQISRF